MGQRGAGAAFMPSKYVFPGGAVDPEDARVPVAAPLPGPCAARLAARPVTTMAPDPATLAASAIRELWEETGLRLGRPGQGRDDGLGPSWTRFLATGVLPDPSTLRFVFRAITPVGRPRRFDARFFLADARAILGDPDDFGAAEDELSHLHWVPLAEARALDLPFITEVVLAEIEARLPALAAPREVPFVINDDTSRIEML
jgi:8-oxo-dGTP pyrophosphatase MutT (NUDIX family)